MDTDVTGLNRSQVLEGLRKFYGSDRVANVLTLGTEGSKSAILSAARGLGIDVDKARYLSSMVEADRGMTRTLRQVFYGDEENGIAANPIFRREMENNYPKLWEAALMLEGLIVRSGIHAGGVIFVDEPFTESAALMRAPDGTVITQFDLHAAEKLSLIKMDLLSVEAIDKIQTCLELLCEQGYVKRYPTLRETYEEALGVYKIERDDSKMWELLTDHKVFSLFQMEGETGIQGIDKMRPSSVDDLAVLNSAIRLMAQEKGGETPTEKLTRFKNDHQLWVDEATSYGVTEEEQKAIWPILSTSYGLCIAQEQFMQLVQLEELGGFNLTFADKLRKSIAKKSPKDFDKLADEFYKVTAEKGISKNFAEYAWNVLISMSKGYGFNQSHTLAYSLIALQEMNLVYKYPPIFWNTACLITDAGGISNDEDDDGEEDISAKPDEEEVVNIYEPEDTEEYEYVDAPDRSSKTKKKKQKSIDYGKIAKAIGRCKHEGINVSTPNINKSELAFYPDVTANTIRYGLGGIARINNELVSEIIEKRPFSSFEDFMGRISTSAPQMVNLIKSGAFDDFGNRHDIMSKYLITQADTKDVINLRNLNLLMRLGLLPQSLALEQKLYNYDSYIKKSLKEGVYALDNIAFKFYESQFDVDDLVVMGEAESGFGMPEAIWKPIYKKAQASLKDYIVSNSEVLKSKVNAAAMSQVMDKYAAGSIESWEMESVSFYSGCHELDKMDTLEYNVEDWEMLECPPHIESFYKKDGVMYPIYSIYRIAGTVLEKNKLKHTITLLTQDGVVTVKLYGDAFTNFDRQISAKGADGKKKVLEKSFFSRGNKIIVSGIKTSDSQFLAKKYRNTPYPLIELITAIDDNGLISTKSKRCDE